jgi:hypothetical protein
VFDALKFGREVVHRRKPFGGKSPKDVHREIVFGGRRCDAPGGTCARPVVVEIRVNALVADVKAHNPEAFEVLAIDDGTGRKVVPVFETIFGPAVRMTRVYACAEHRKAAEQAAARGPSWAFVEISDGPGDPKIQVSMPAAPPAAG